MFTVLGLDHVVIRANDPKELIRFYQDVLGCKLERELPELGLFQLRAGLSLIDVLARREAADPAEPNMDHFCLRIEPFDAATLASHFQSLDVPARVAPRVYGAEGFGPALYVQDPEGNTVELKGPAGG
ncbi:MAG: VOC family protein [Pseudomonadales bacterium]|nr:VOC family protein [Pseudomonadales bacterium]NIX07889.1 VOC family protein [Pseudomonadales bacterium]